MKIATIFFILLVIGSSACSSGNSSVTSSEWMHLSDDEVRVIKILRKIEGNWIIEVQSPGKLKIIFGTTIGEAEYWEINNNG